MLEQCYVMTTTVYHQHSLLKDEFQKVH